MTFRPEPHRAERGHDFWPPAAELAAIPALYATDDTGPMSKRVVHLHYFCGRSDWWVIEFDPGDSRAYGYVSLAGNGYNAEWGYFDLDELASFYVAPRRGVLGRELWPPVVVERDLGWVPRVADEVESGLPWVPRVIRGMRPILPPDWT